MDYILQASKHYKNMVPVYGAMLLFSFHYSLIAFLNSSLLLQYWSDTHVNTLYIIGSVFSVFFLLYAGRLVSKTNPYAIFIASVILETIGTLLITFSHDAFFTAVGFIIMYITVGLLYYAFDIFLEIVNKNEEETGRVRAIIMTIASFILVISPFIAAQIVSHFSFNAVYGMSLIFLIPLLPIGKRYFKKLHAPHVAESLHHTMLSYIHNSKLRRIFEAKCILSVFYAVMVIYLPIHLHNTLGFSWEQIGIILAIMLIPFLILDFPYGILADTYGEKEIMTFGFVTAAISMILLFSMDTLTVFSASTLLFLSRVGAAAIDVGSESYFFKQVNGSCAELISFFRLAVPLSYILTPLLFGYLLHALGTHYMFLFLSITMILGLLPVILIEDTK